MSVKWIGLVYHRIKTWLICFAVAAPLILHYAPVSPEWERKGLPLAVACAFGIVVELLTSIQRQLDDRIVAYKEYASATDCIPDIINLVKRKSRRGRHVVKVLASTGGTTVNVLLPRLISTMREQHETLDFRICVINPASPLSSLMPAHWVDEAGVSVRRLVNAAGAEVNLTCSQYDYVPCLRGMLVDEAHLFVSFFTWSKGDNEFLSGADQPHLYLRRGGNNEYFFQLWEGWFDHAPSQRIFPKATA